MEPDEESQPLVDVGDAGAVKRVAASAASSGTSRVASRDTPIASTAEPQEGQKRALSETALPQREQNTAGF